MTRTYRRLQILALTLAGLGAAYGCGDKILTAKTTIGFVSLGFQTAKAVVDRVVMTKHAECSKLGTPESEAYKGCFAKTAKMVTETGKLWPQADALMETASAAVKAYEQKLTGQPVDFVTPIKKGVCLLVKLATWLPPEYQKKIQLYLSLASAYACESSASVVSHTNQYQLAKRLVTLLRDLGARG